MNWSSTGCLYECLAVLLFLCVLLVKIRKCGVNLKYVCVRGVLVYKRGAH